MHQRKTADYMRGFLPYALAAFLIGIVGGFSAVLGPAFVRDLGLDYNVTTWTALAQAMSSAACSPILGQLGDRLGRRTTLLLGIGLFTLGNLLTAFAFSLPFMLAARFVVGVGTAAVAPVILSYIVTCFPPEAAARGFSLYMLLSSISVVFGPTLGSLVIGAFGWRVMMFGCAALAALILVLCFLTCEKTPPPSQVQRNFDAVGAALVLVFFSLVLCLPALGQNFGWTSTPFLTAGAAAALSLLLLIPAERRAVSPVLPASFLLRRNFLLSVAALFFTQGLMQANTTNLIVFVDYTRPGSSLLSGSAVSILYLGMALGAALLGPLADRFPPKLVLTGALLLTGSGCAVMLLFSRHTPFFLLLLSLGLLGFGLGGNGTILMKTALTGAAPQQAGSGTGIYGLFRDLAAPFGVAVLVPLFTNQTSRLIAAGTETAGAAVSAIHTLAIVELCCVFAGIAAVALLPGPMRQKGAFHETKK